MQAGFHAERPHGYQQLLAAAVDAGTLLTIPTGTGLIMITPEGQAVRWRDDGTDPTATVGMPLMIGQVLMYSSSRPGQLKFISQVAGAILNVTYYSA